jgi:benzoate-CoA ligase
VSPAEVEARLVEHAAVVEAAVVGRADADGLVVPYACVVLTAGMPPEPALAAELLAFVRARLPAFKCPRAVEFVADLPKTATGKVQRFRLREP